MAQQGGGIVKDLNGEEGALEWVAEAAAGRSSGGFRTKESPAHRERFKGVEVPRVAVVCLAVQS